MKRVPRGAKMDRFRGVPIRPGEYKDPDGEVDDTAAGCIPCATCPGFRAPDEPCQECALLVQRGRGGLMQEDVPEFPSRYNCCENIVQPGKETCPDCGPQEGETFMEAQDRIIDKARRRDRPPTNDLMPCGMPRATHSKDCPRCGGGA